MKKVIIFTFEGNKYIDSVKKSLASKNIETVIAFNDEYVDNINEYDLGVFWSYAGSLEKSLIEKIPCINVQPSLLPKFNTKSAIEDNFYSNDKYGGVTIHHLNNEEHFLTQESFWKEDAISLESFKEQIFEIASRLLPRVIEDILYSKINVLIISDKKESKLYNLLLNSPFVNSLFSDDFNCNVVQKYLHEHLDICLFDIDGVPSDKMLQKCSSLKVNPIIVSHKDVSSKNNIYFCDSKNIISLYEYLDCESVKKHLKKTSLKQIVFSNFEINKFSKTVDNDFAELLINILLENLDYTFLHLKK